MSNRQKKKIPGSIKIVYNDEKGNRIFEWKQNRSGNNVETGIYEMLEFFKHKMSIDIVKYIEDLSEQHQKKGEEKNGDD
jgi:hypothetical protein